VIEKDGTPEGVEVEEGAIVGAILGLRVELAVE
jgi:hypothetical protein